jgi:DNA-binding LytR/AlgR family response regulator
MIKVIGFDTIPTKGNVQGGFSALGSALEPIRELTYNVKKSEITDPQRIEHSLDDIILVKNQTRLVKLQVRDILFIEGKGNYVSLVTGKGKILTLQTMKKLEDFLSPYQFVRIHKSFIVSFHQIESIDNHAVYINKMDIPISDSYRYNFRLFLAENAKQI